MSAYEAKDVKGKPSRDRAFPVPFSAVVHECKEHGILNQSGKRIQVAMRNLKFNSKKVKENYWLLVELSPKKELTIYSVPDAFDLSIASKITLEAITAFGFLNAYPMKQLNSCDQFFQAFLFDQSQLSLWHAFWHYKRPKYRGDSKFSNAFHKKSVRTEFKNFHLVNSRIEYTGHSGPKRT